MNLPQNLRKIKTKMLTILCVRAGMIAVDDTTINYVKGRPYSPVGPQWDQAVAYWRTLHSDAGAQFDMVVYLNAAEINHQVSCAFRF